MVARRRREAAAAGAAFGFAGTDWLGLREGEWEEPGLVSVLLDALRRTRPHVVSAPSCVDFHPEHTSVARCVARAIAGLGSRDLAVCVYQLQVLTLSS
jgi:LmbE family N-acetylglucosaminyl deacetylase